MEFKILNRDLLPGNDCFGCGLENKHGLHIELFQKEEEKDKLHGIFHPPPYLAGFPGITHGGIIYTALDCLAAWVPTILKKEIKAIWILRHASITYHRPAHEGDDIFLTGKIVQEGLATEPLTVHATAYNVQNDLLTEGNFKVIPLSVEKFKKVAAIDQLPKNWRIFLKEECNKVSSL